MVETFNGHESDQSSGGPVRIPSQALPYFDHEANAEYSRASNPNADFMFYEGSVDHEADLDQAVERICQGEAVACWNGQVFGIWGDAANPAFIESIKDIKGEGRLVVEEGKEPKLRPMGLTIPFDYFVNLIDMRSLAPAMQEWVQQPGQLASRLAGLAFVRCVADPHKVAAQNVPESVLSYDDETGELKIQNYDPAGSPVEPLVQKLMERGIRFIGVTSLNESNQDEITTAEDSIDEKGELHEGAISFARRKNLMLLTRSGAHPPYIGSYRILSMEDLGFIEERKDALDREVYEKLLFDCDYRVSPTCKESKFGTLSLPESHYLEGAAMRERVLEFAYGKSQA